MKIQLRNGALFDYRRLSLGATPIGVFDAGIKLNDSEKDQINQFCQMIWRHLMIATGNPKFTGIIRFDLVPRIRSDGTVEIVFIYEVNAHSPECIAVAAALGQKNIVQIIVDQIQKTFGNEKIAFVIGNCDAKNSWGMILFNCLLECGLDIVCMSEEEVMKNRPQLLWRWGDLRTEPGDACHFSDKFSEWILNNNDSLSIFNSVLPPESDFSRKSFLRTSDDPAIAKILGNNRALNSVGDIAWSLWHGHGNFVIKPNGGASGYGFRSGKSLSVLGWTRESVRALFKGNYSIWESHRLPDHNGLTFDIGPTYWVRDSQIGDPLYILMRADNTIDYENRDGVINVAQGAGVAEMIPF